MSIANAPAAEPRLARASAPSGKGLDRAGLLEQLSALYQEHSADMAAFHRSAIATLQAALAAGRDEARRALEAGGAGRACAETLSAHIDDLLRVALETATRWLSPPAANAALPTIVAVGGYGRGMLAPGSDIDLLFLLPNKPTPAVEKIVEALLYVLWDLKQKVGHATRTVDECLKQARADMTIRTTLIEARLVTGDRKLFQTLQTRFDREIVAKTAPEFVAAKLAEREQRVRRAGASRYLVEPNVKEGKGGLRDLNTLFWISKYVYRVQNAHELVGAGLFSPREFALFRRCEEFLWSVRCRLHFLAGRAEERLSFDVQRPIARQLGYSTRAGQADVERFMKHYFLVAKDVGDLTAIVCAALEERQTKPTPVFDRFIGRLRRRTRAIADAQDFRVDNDRVNIVRTDAFERDPVNLIRIFWIADRSNLPIHPDAARLVTQSLKRIDAARARGPRGEPPVPRNSDFAPRPGNDAEADERGRRPRPLHPRFRPRRRDDAVLDVPPLYDRRASDPHRRRAQRDRGGTPPEGVSARQRDRPQDRASHGALSRRLPARHRQGPAERPFARGRRGGAQALPAARAFPGRHGPRRLACRAASDHVQHGAGARPFRPAHGGSAGGDRPDAGTAQDAVDPDRRRHSRRRPGRLERMEGPAPAESLLGNRGRARRRPFGGRPQIARRGGAGGPAARAARLVRPRVRGLRPAPLSRLLAEGRSRRARSRTPNCCMRWRPTCARSRPR